MKIADLPEAGALDFANPVVAVQGPDDALVTVQSTVGDVAEKAVEKVTVTGFGELGDTRSYAAKLSDMPYSGDYKGLTPAARIAAGMEMVSEVGGGILTVEAGPIDAPYQPPPYDVVVDFDGPMVNRSTLGGGSTVNFRRATLGRIKGDRNNNTRTSLTNITAYAEGSGQNGIANGDVAMEIRIDKENWSNPALAKAGEIDGLFIYSRQGGPVTGTKSALGGLVVDVGMTKGTGFLCGYEMVSTIFDPENGLAATHQIDLQSAVLNSRDGDYYGYIFTALKGEMDAAIFIKNDASAGSSWGRILQNAHDGVTNFWMTVAGEIVFNPLATTATRIKLANSVGAFEVRNNSDVALFGVGQNKQMVSAAVPWGSGEIISPNDVRTNEGRTYRCVELGGVTSDPPVQTSGTVTGADGVRWKFERDDNLAPFASSENGDFFVNRINVISAQGSAPSVSIVAAPGAPNGQLSEPIASIALRPNGSYGRSVYVKEAVSDATGWTPVITASFEGGIAATGSSQGDARQLERRASSVATGALGSGVILSGLIQDEQIVFNRNVNNLLVYPPIGGQIGNATVNEPVLIEPNGFARFMWRGTNSFYISGTG